MALQVTNLIGFMSYSNSGVAPLTSVTYQAESVGLSATWPTVQAGDLALVLEYGDNSSSGLPVSNTTLTGFSLVRASNDSISAFQIHYKICDGTETGTLTGGMTADTYRIILLILRPDRPIVTVTPTSFTHQYTSGNPTAQVVPSGSGVAPLIVIGAYNVFSGTISPVTFSTTADGSAASGASSSVLAWKTYITSPADTTIDMDDEGARMYLASGYLQLT